MLCIVKFFKCQKSLGDAIRGQEFSITCEPVHFIELLSEAVLRGSNGHDGVDNLFVYEALVKGPKLVDLFDEHVELLSEPKVGHPDHPGGPPNPLHLMLSLYLCDPALGLVFNVDQFLLNYRELRLQLQYRLFFGYTSDLVVHFSELVEVVIGGLFEEGVGFFLSDDVELFLGQLVVANGLDIGDEPFQSLVHLQHLVLGRDLLDLFVQSKSLQFFKALTNVGLEFVLLTNVIV